MIHILLIDDDETEFRLIKRMLEDCYHAPHKLRYADTLEKAVSILRNDNIDVILLDDKLGAGRTAKSTVQMLQDISDTIPMIVISSIIDSVYLKDKTILNVYDIVDKYKLREKIANGMLSSLK